MIGGTLYRRGCTLPFLKCISKVEANYVLREIHEGVCDSHTGSRMLTNRAIRSGYFWPHMNEDSVNIVRNCDKCQRFARVMKSPLKELSSVLAPWPFVQWGFDILGPLPSSQGGCGFLVVAVDYFTKWVKVEALAEIMARNIRNFLCKSVVCQARHSTRLCDKKWQAIQLQLLPTMVRGTAYLELLFYTAASPSERASRGNQQDLEDNIEEKAEG